MFTQIKVHLTDAVFGSNVEAFHFPFLFVATGFISFFLIGYQAYSIYHTFAAMADNFRSSASLPIRKAFAALLSAQSLYYEQLGQELTDKEQQHVFDASDDMMDSMTKLGDSINITGNVALAVAVVIGVLAWVQCVAVFREESLTLRRTGKASTREVQCEARKRFSLAS